MSQSKESSNGSFSSNGKKTNYNKHFPRSFLLNYGPAIQDISKEGVLNRLHEWNCEWLKRPNIAMSEMAMTVKDNLPLLCQFSGSVFQEQFVEDLVAPFEDLHDALVKLDNKDKSNNDPATRQDVVGVLRTIDVNEILDQAIQDAFNAAGPMFMVCVQLLALQTLMRNPHNFAEKSSRTPQNEHFRHDPTPKRMRDYLLDSIIKRRRPVSRKVSMWDDDDDDNDDDDQSEGRPAPRRRFQRASSQPSRRGGQTCSSTWDDSTPANSRGPRSRDSGVASSSSSDTRRTKNKPPPPAAKKQRRQKVVPLDSSSERSSDEEENRGPAKRKNLAEPPAKTSTPKKTSKPLAVSFSSSSSSGSESSEDEEPPKKKSKAAPNQTERPSAASSSAETRVTPRAASNRAGTSKGKQPVNGQSLAKNRPENGKEDEDDPWKGLGKAAKGKNSKKSEL